MAMTMETAITADLLAACHYSIQSLARSLATLQSINAVQHLQEDAKTLEAFATIASFAPLLLSGKNHLSGAHAFESERVFPERRADDSASDEIQDGLNTGDVDAFSKFLHPVAAGTNPLDRPLYSFLVYYPSHAIRDSDPHLPVDREKVLSIIHPELGVAGARASLYLLKHPYPRVRLLEGSKTGQRALLIIDDDAERLSAIHDRFKAIQQSEWDNANLAPVGVSLSLTGLWSERHTVLAFTTNYSYKPNNLSAKDRSYLAEIEKLSRSPRLLWKALLARFPVLSLYQHPMMETIHNLQGDSNFVGGRYFCRQLPSALGRAERGTFFVPLYNSGDFAEDFVATNPKFTVPVGGTAHRIGFRPEVVVLEPPTNFGPPGLPWNV